MSLPPSSFADAFRTHVVPKLRGMIDQLGLSVALGQDTFTTSHAEVMGLALQHGAACLPPEHFDNLVDWAQTALLNAAAAAEELYLAMEAERNADPASYFDSLAASCFDPDRMRWIFASIYPEYRKCLIARRSGI